MGNETSSRKPARPAVVTSEPVRDGGPVEAAHFIRDALADLTGLAQRHRLDMLVYLLDMARLEAGEAIRLGSQQRQP